MPRDEIPPGTLYMLILRTLARDRRLHGYEIARAIKLASRDVLEARGRLGSTLALQRMLLKGWVQASWGTTAENRRARYYVITAAGRRQLAHEISQFSRVFGAIHLVIQPA